MNISVAQRLPFALLQSGMPLRIEVKDAIHFGPLNQRTCHTVLPRIELGMKISWILDGYWGKDEHGRIRRLASLEKNIMPTNGEHLDIVVDLRTKEFDELREFYHLLTGLRFILVPHVLL
jgi:hypothetical protein